MADAWFRLPKTGTEGSLNDPPRPDLFGHSVDGRAGNASHPDGSPRYVVRVYADQATLDNLASEPVAVRLSDVPAVALNQITGLNRGAAEWEQHFTVG